MRFITRLMALRWNTYRKQRKADIALRDKLKQQQNELVQGVSYTSSLVIAHFMLTMDVLFRA